MERKKKKEKENNNIYEEEMLREGETRETNDIYDDEQREEMLADDEITAAESAFMAGREMNIRKQKKKWMEHEDSISVEMAEEEYHED
ncbi:MAG: hypothetical protein L6M37_03025 [Candidatus Methylarchaceae archaeon HK02M1]|nr:hypothetical protein [Candidatus Methylarchaceae archaeon HK02M1]